MPIRASDFVQAVIHEYERGCGYIWGMTGQIWTETLQKKGSKQNNNNTQRYGSRWLGYNVYDCSGLPYALLKKLGLNVPHGCNSIYDNGYLSEKGKLSSFPKDKLLPGMAVFLAEGSNEHHMGTYVGDGWVIEAYGTQTGVTISRLDKWNEAGLYKGMTYDLPVDWQPSFRFDLTRPPMAVLTTIRKGDAGPCVRYLQLLMLRSGHRLTVDHYFSADMQQWVRAYQQQHDLVVDGVVGPKTWAALEHMSDTIVQVQQPTASVPDEPAADLLPPSLAAILAELRTLHTQLGQALTEAEALQKGMNP